MDYKTLLDVTVELGYQLAMCGAETFRIEECVVRIFRAYAYRFQKRATSCLFLHIEY